jgi:hypothetical protein
MTLVLLVHQGLINVSDMSSMFEGAVNFNHSIGNWECK